MKLGSQRGRTTGRHADFSEKMCFFLMFFELDNDHVFFAWIEWDIFCFPGGDALMKYEPTIIW